MEKRRRKLIVNRQFQSKYLVLTLGLMIVVAVILAWITFYINWSRLSSNYPQILVERGLYQVFQQISGTIFWTNLAIIFVAVCVGGTLVLVASQRIAGPLIRFKKVAESIAEGEPVTTIRLRKKDELRGTEKDINKIIKAVNELQSKNSEMNKEISNIREKLSHNLEREIISRESLAATVQQLAEMVTKFRSTKSEQRR
ncbi:MAG: methyl-accepting chemotaxis protein [Nitrospirae bacterium]|nr:methyl-accepting chemotaxis protein [Nitrospirota bacterium]